MLRRMKAFQSISQFSAKEEERTKQQTTLETSLMDWNGRNSKMPFPSCARSAHLIYHYQQMRSSMKGWFLSKETLVCSICQMHSETQMQMSLQKKYHKKAKSFKSMRSHTDHI